MIKLILVLGFLVLFPLAALAGGDEVELKDGSTLQGDIIAKNALQIYLSQNGEVKRIDVSDIRRIKFGPGTVVSSIQQQPPANMPGPQPSASVKPRGGTLRTSNGQDMYLNR